MSGRTEERTYTVLEDFVSYRMGEILPRWRYRCDRCLTYGRKVRTPESADRAGAAHMREHGRRDKARAQSAQGGEE